MIKYIGKRLVLLIPVILAASFLVFAIVSLTPGNPARIMLGPNAKEEEVKVLEEEMGLNDPFLVRYGTYVKDAVLHQDLGKSYTTKQPVVDEILDRFPVTLKLAALSVLLAVLIAVPAGIISAVKQYSFLDNLTVFLSMCLTAIPTVWLGLMLMLWLSLDLGIFPSSGVNSWMGYVLPAISLSAYSCAFYTRMTRSSMLEVVRHDYIRTAVGKGLSRAKAIWSHAIRNALLPVVTIIGIDFGYLLGGAIIIENVFAISGLGRLMVEGIRQKDMPVVMGSVLFMAVAFSIVNLIVDIVYAYIDPRIKAQYKRGG